MYVQPLDGPLTPNALAAPAGAAEYEGAPFAGAAAPATGDNISRFVPPWSNDGAQAMPYGEGSAASGSLQGMFAPLMGMLQQLMQMLQSLMGTAAIRPRATAARRTKAAAAARRPAAATVRRTAASATFATRPRRATAIRICLSTATDGTIWRRSPICSTPTRSRAGFEFRRTSRRRTGAA